MLVAILSPAVAMATDWSAPEQHLARKILAVSGPVPVFVTFQNRSSLGRRDSEIVQNGIRSVLETMGVRLSGSDRATATVVISLSENWNSYVWVAQIRRSGNDESVVMVSFPRPKGANTVQDSPPLTLLKIPIWSQAAPILDLAVLEESAAPTRVAVLTPDNLSLYRLQSGKWLEEDALQIAHNKPWPRDIRGRLVAAKDHSLEAYLPGVVCRGTANPPPTLNCAQSAEAWPIGGPNDAGGMATERASFADSRNYFSGELNPPVGKFAVIGRFYSMANLSRDNSVFWLFAETDGQVHLVDGLSDQIVSAAWGSEMAAIKTACGAGRQIVATGGKAAGDAVRAYELPERDPVGVSAPVEFSGTITALWTEARGDTAILVTENSSTGNYEAFRLAVSCNR